MYGGDVVGMVVVGVVGEGQTHQHLQYPQSRHMAQPLRGAQGAQGREAAHTEAICGGRGARREP